jgi:hypothetical protein
LGLGASLSIGTSQLNGDGIANAKNKLSWSLGGQAQYNLGKYFALNSGIIFQNKGGKAKGTETAGIIQKKYEFEETYNLYDAQVPLHLQANIPLGNLKLLVFAGPDLNFNLMGLESRVYEDDGYNEQNGFENAAMSNLEVFNLGLTYGVGLSASTSAGDEYFLRVGITNGMQPIGLLNANDAKANLGQITLGYIFR